MKREVVMEPLVFALDFDDTFTADPELWAAWIVMAKRRGHKVYCVTARRDHEENRQEIFDLFDEWHVEIPVIFCNLGSKTWTMEQRGIKVNIWIDDAPHALVHGH